MTEQPSGIVEDGRTLAEHSVLIAARIETVWGIVSDPDRFGDWLQGRAAFAPEPGSDFEIDFPQFETRIRGEVLEYEPERHRFVVSWGVASGPQAATLPIGSSKVELWLVSEEGGTRAHVRHSALPSEKEARDHEAGWRFHLSRLSLFANRADLEASLGPALAAFYGAWNEPDPEARTGLLARCCAPDVTYRDEYASLEGRDLLGLHMGNTQRFIPGWRIERTGEPRICRGEALVDWRAGGETLERPAGGETLERRTGGTHHLVVDPDGTLRRITAFENP